MRSILKDMGVTGTFKLSKISHFKCLAIILEYERRVVQQMLEYAYRYTTEILEEARVYSNHTKHKRVNIL